MSGLTGTEVPRKGLRVRAPCPPLSSKDPQKRRVFEGVFLWHTLAGHEHAERGVLCPTELERHDCVDGECELTAFGEGVIRAGQGIVGVGIEPIPTCFWTHDQTIKR